MNISSYAYENEIEMVEFTLEVSDKIVMSFCDSGKKFNPLERNMDIEDYNIDSQIGGLGIFLAAEIVDNSEYKYENNKNILILTKYI